MESELELDSDGEDWLSQIDSEAEADFEWEDEVPVDQILVQMGFSEEKANLFAQTLAQVESGTDAEAEAQWGFIRNIWARIRAARARAARALQLRRQALARRMAHARRVRMMRLRRMREARARA